MGVGQGWKGNVDGQCHCKKNNQGSTHQKNHFNTWGEYRK